MAAEPRWKALEASDWEAIAEALDFAAQAAEDEADAIRRGYSSGTDGERAAHLANADRWRALADIVRPS